MQLPLQADLFSIQGVSSTSGSFHAVFRSASGSAVDDAIAVRSQTLLMISPRLKTSVVVLLSGLLAEGLRAVVPRIRSIWKRRCIAADHLLPPLQGYEVLIKGDKQQNGANKAGLEDIELGPLLGHGSYGQVYHGKVEIESFADVIGLYRA